MDPSKCISVTPIDVYVGNIKTITTTVQFLPKGIVLTTHHPSTCDIVLSWSQDVKRIMCCSVIEDIDIPVSGHYVYVESKKRHFEGFILPMDGSSTFDPESKDPAVRYIVIKLDTASTDFLAIYLLVTSKCSEVATISSIEAISRFLTIKFDSLYKNQFLNSSDQTNSNLDKFSDQSLVCPDELVGKSEESRVVKTEPNEEVTSTMDDLNDQILGLFVQDQEEGKQNLDDSSTDIDEDTIVDDHSEQEILSDSTTSGSNSTVDLSKRTCDSSVLDEGLLEHVRRSSPHEFPNQLNLQPLTDFIRSANVAGHQKDGNRSVPFSNNTPRAAKPIRISSRKLENVVIYFGNVKCLSKEITFFKTRIEMVIEKVESSLCDICRSIKISDIDIIYTCNDPAVWLIRTKAWVSVVTVNRFRALDNCPSLKGDFREIFIRLHDPMESLYRTKCNRLTTKKASKMLLEKRAESEIKLEVQEIHFGQIKALPLFFSLNTEKLSFKARFKSAELNIEMKDLISVDYSIKPATFVIKLNQTAMEQVINCPKISGFNARQGKKQFDTISIKTPLMCSDKWARLLTAFKSNRQLVVRKFTS